MNNEIMSPESMKLAATQLCDQLSAAAVDCAAILGWPGVFRAVRDAATATEDGYVAGVAEAAAGFIEGHGG